MTTRLIVMISIFPKTVEKQVVPLPGTRCKLTLFLSVKLGVGWDLLWCGQLLARSCLKVIRISKPISATKGGEERRGGTDGSSAVTGRWQQSD